MTVPYILAGSTACVLTSLAAGLSAIRALRMELNRAESLCLGYCLGSAIVSTLTLALAFLSLARKGVFVAVTLVALVFLWRLLPWFRALQPTPIGSIPVFYRAVFVAWLVYGSLYFRYALAPERSPDGISYHLGLVNLWDHAHGLSRIVDMYAALPQGMEMLYLFAFSMGRHSAAALIHFSFLMLLPVLMILYGIRFGFSRGAAVCAALIVFVTPMVGWDGSVSYNDVGLAVIEFAAVYLLQIWRGHAQTAYLVGASLLAGFAFAVKYTGFGVFILIAGTVIWELRRESAAPMARALAIAGAFTTIAPLPYLIRNAVWFQNPVAPFGNSVFPNPYFHISFEREYIRGLAHLNGVKWRDLPRELTVGGPKLPTSLGPIYLIAPLALAGSFWPQGRYAMMAALALGCGYLGNKDARFLIPVLPPLLLALTYALSRSRLTAALASVLTVCQLVLCWPAIVARIQMPHVPGPRLDEIPWTVALRQIPEEQYLSSEVDEYVMARQIESHVPQGQTVFAIAGGVAQSYTTRFVLDNYRSARAEKAKDLLYTNCQMVHEARRYWTAVFPATRARQLRIVQLGRSDWDWIITEIRLRSGDKLIAPSPQWRTHVVPNPWDASLLFDGGEAEHWRSWEPVAREMEIDVRLNPEEFVDRVEVHSDDGQWFSKMDAQIETEGRWVHPVSTGWQMKSAVDLRKAATQVLKKQGIRYVVISGGAWYEQEFRGQPALWGMHEVLSTKNSTLYMID